MERRRTPTPHFLAAQEAAPGVVESDNPPLSLAHDTKVNIPLAALLAVAVALLAIGGTWATLRASLASHDEDTIRHLDQSRIRERGGPVYREDLREAVDGVRRDIRDEFGKIRGAIERRETQLVCRKRRDGNLICTNEEP